MDENNLAVRRELLKSARQVVVKAGTRLLTSQEAIAELVSGIDVLRRAGKRVLLVTSGAVDESRSDSVTLAELSGFIVTFFVP